MGDTNVGNAPLGMQIEVEFALAAAKSANIDNATENGCRLHIAVDETTRHLVDDQIYALSVCCVQYQIGPIRISRIDGKIGAIMLESGPAISARRRSYYQLRAGYIRPGLLCVQCGEPFTLSHARLDASNVEDLSDPFQAMCPECNGEGFYRHSDIQIMVAINGP